MATTPPPSYYYYPLGSSDDRNGEDCGGGSSGSLIGSRLIAGGSLSNNSSLLSLSSFLRGGGQESQTMMTGRQQELRDSESGTSRRNTIWSAAGLKRSHDGIWPFSTSANLLLDHPAVAAKIHSNLDNVNTLSEVATPGPAATAGSDTDGAGGGSPSPLQAPVQLGEPQTSESAAAPAAPALPPASQFILSSYVKPLDTTITTSETAATCVSTTDGSNSSRSSDLAPMPGAAKRPRLSSTSSRSDHNETVSANSSVASISSPTVVRTTTTAAASGSTKTRPPKKRYLTNEKRLERNAREQARSNRLSEQFAELRHLLEKAGIVVPKGTKGSILSIAMDYIRRLQEETAKKDSMGGPSSSSSSPPPLPPPSPSLLSGGGGDGVLHTSSPSSPRMVVNNKSGKLPHLQEPQNQEHQKKKNIDDETEQEQEEDSSADDDCFFNYYYYRFAFEHCTNGMAITTLGGSFMKSNQEFRRLTKQTRDQLQHLSIFNFTAPEDLSYAFDKLSQVLLVADQHQNQQQEEKSSTYANSTGNCYCPPSSQNIIQVQSSIPGGLDLHITPILCDHQGHNRLLVTLVEQKQQLLQEQLKEAVSSFTGTSATAIRSLPSAQSLLQSFPLCPAPPPPSPLMTPRTTVTRTADTSSVTEDCSDHSCTSSSTYYSGGEDGNSRLRIGNGSSTCSNHNHDGAMIAPTTAAAAAAAAAHQGISISDSTNIGDDTLTALRAIVATTNSEIKAAAAQAEGFYTTG